MSHAPDTKAPTDEARELALAIYLATGSLKKAASAVHAKPNTVKKWKQRYKWRSFVPPSLSVSLVKAPEVVPPEGQWMQSLHHESAHFITEGLTACSRGDNGAKIDAGGKWFPHNGCLRKCTRCLGALQKHH